jgi:hypothetical protein
MRPLASSTIYVVVISRQSILLLDPLLTLPEIGGVLFCSMNWKILMFWGCSLKSFDISSKVVDPGESGLIISDLTFPVNREKPVRDKFKISAQTDSIFAGSEPQCGVARKKMAAVDLRMFEKRLSSTTVILIA